MVDLYNLKLVLKGGHTEHIKRVHYPQIIICTSDESTEWMSTRSGDGKIAYEWNMQDVMFWAEHKLEEVNQCDTDSQASDK